LTVGGARRALAGWWPLAALVILAAVARLSTLSLQSLWYDEAYTPVHVLHPSLLGTLHSVAASENTPPLWYVLEWSITRVLGTGVIALRLLSALAGVALVAVGWAIGAQLGSRRTAVTLAAILALNPLFIWYSQEARAYELYALLSAVSLLYFLRAHRSPGPTVLALWAASSALALLTHYFAAFLVAPEALILLSALLPTRTRHALRRPAAQPAAAPGGSSAAPAHADGRAATLAAVAVVTVCAGALVPLISAQGGRGTQWIGHWALSARLVAIASYYLLGANGSVLGHGLLTLSALPLVAAIAIGCALAARARYAPGEPDSLRLLLGLGLAAMAIPLLLALAGADYLAPRNLIGDWVVLSAALAVVLATEAAGRLGAVLAVMVCVSGAAVAVATDLDHRLARPDWSALAATLAGGPSDRVIVSVEDGAAPLEYYLPSLRLRYLSRRLSASLGEIDLVGYAPLRPDATHAPTPAFVLVGRTDVDGLLAYRYLAAHPQSLSGRFLRSLTITAGSQAGAEVLLAAAIATARN
jgi:mannosyltransferase